MTIADPKATLHPTALKILDAAQHIIQAKGLRALTLESVAQEAGVNKAATRYYFGGKPGLLMAIVDEIVLDACASWLAPDESEAMSCAERVDSFVRNAARIVTHFESYYGYFDILPHAVRTKELRDRLVVLYKSWYESNLEQLGLAGEPGAAADPRLLALGPFTAALIDGLAIQMEIHGEGYDPQPTLDLLREFLTFTLTGSTSTEGLHGGAIGAPATV